MTGRPPVVCGNFTERYFGRHAADPDENEPGACMCGLALSASVHLLPVVPRSEIEGQWHGVEPIHTLACTQVGGVCRSMHCPHCGVATGPQGHGCAERPR